MSDTITIPVRGTQSASRAEISVPRRIWEICLVLLVFVAFAGDPAPAINEAHYLVKAKHFWDPSWCAGDLFATSGNAHATFYWCYGWLTRYFALDTTAWIGRLVGWTLLAIGWHRLCWSLVPVRYACVASACIWLPALSHGNLAGEWIVGGMEAKVPAYGCVFLALEQTLRQRWPWVWPLLGLASAFHVLVGGWSVLIAAGIWLAIGRSHSGLWHQLPGLIGGGLFSLAGLIPGLSLSAAADPAASVFAAQVYVFDRLPHHLLPSHFPVSWYLRHGGLLLLTVVVCALQKSDVRFRTLMLFTAGAVALAVVGGLIGWLTRQHPEWAARLLRYYWFRMTDAMVPILFSIATLRLAYAPTRIAPMLAGFVAITLTLSGVVLIAQHVAERFSVAIPPAADQGAHGHASDASLPVRQQVFADWQKVCEWIRFNSNPEDVFLTPRHQQTFKWFAHRAEVVNFKDVPQDAESLRHWRSRFERVFPQSMGRAQVTISYAELEAFKREFGAQWMVVDRRITPFNLPLRQVYPTPWEPNATYAVYRLP